MTTTDILAALTEQNLQVAAGTIGGNPQPADQTFEYSVLTNSRISTVEQFEKIVVRTIPATGTIVHLKDVARVELGKFSYASNAFVNGKPAAFVLIYQAPGANAISTFDGINAALAKLKETFPKDLDFVMPLETVTVVKVSMREVLYTLLEALLLVVIVVFLFLQSWRATLIPVLAIPVSLIGTFIFFIPFGFTINTLTLFAFVLAIGIVVDDAIVVVEAVQHYIDHERISAKEATIKAMKDISGPVIAIALILAAVFVPVGFSLFTGYFFNPSYKVTDLQDQIVARLKKEPSLFGRRFEITKLKDFDNDDDERIILGMMMMILLERRRG